jgi:two-component system, sensor histidine kinase and response regulator
LSKIEAGKVELENVEFELPVIMDELVKLLAPTAFGKGLELGVFLDPALPRTLLGDPLRLKQILINLVGNAIKFTTSGSVIVSAIREVREGAQTLRFSIVDTGSGIAPEKVDKLFKKFSQVDDSTTRNHSGTGLGLALCRELARLMDGMIWYEPTDHKGSAFHLRLALPAEHEAVEKARIAKARSAHGRQIMLASQSRALAKIVDAYSKAMGQSVIWVQNEREVLNALQQNRVDAVIVDQMTTNFELRNFARSLRQPSMPAGPVLVLVDQYPTKGQNVSTGGVTIEASMLRPFGLEYAEIMAGVFARSIVQTEQNSPNSEVAVPQGRLRVLMAEDNAPNRLVATALLRSAGHELEIAEDGLEAVEKALSRRYDVILMDVQMPRLDGLAATKRIRADQVMGQIPIIGLTAGAMKQDRDRCLQAGMSDYLAKPVDWDKLLSLLEQIERAVKSRSTAAA